MKTLLTAACLALLLCGACLLNAAAQTGAKKKAPAKKTAGAKSPKTKKAAAPKTAALQVAPAPSYYPDFYTFYDPTRKGYVYWQDTNWAFTQEKPAFMRTLQTDNLRIQILHDESMQNHPEDRFDQYMKLYPPVNTMPGVTVPIITIDRKVKKDGVKE